MRTDARILGILLTLALVVVPFGCFGAKTVTTTKPTGSTATPTPTEVVIDISSAYANPGVCKGTKFVWVNVDNKTHTVTNDEYAPYFEFFIAPRESVHFDLSGRPGVYVYHCRLHPNETAELIVP